MAKNHDLPMQVDCRY